MMEFVIKHTTLIQLSYYKWTSFVWEIYKTNINPYKKHQLIMKSNTNALHCTLFLVHTFFIWSIKVTSKDVSHFQEYLHQHTVYYVAHTPFILSISCVSKVNIRITAWSGFISRDTYMGEYEKRLTWLMTSYYYCSSLQWSIFFLYHGTQKHAQCLNIQLARSYIFVCRHEKERV